MSAPTSAPLRVRTISTEEHLGFLRRVTEAGGSASFLQTPAWARVKPEWRPESIGWEQATADGTELVGVALVLYRQLPRLPRYLAYLPEGPVIDWSAPDLAAWLDPMAAHLRSQGAFGIRIGPPVVTRRWSAQQVKDGIADETTRSLTALAPGARSVEGARVLSALTAQGWRHQGAEGGFAAGQPQYNFQLPLRTPDGTPRTEAEVLAGMNQLWRRNIKKAAKAGVEVTADGPDHPENTVEAFHALYVETAARDHFTPRPLGYFRTMVDALSGEDPDRIRLWFARHEGDLVAATIAIRVGSHAWYSYGASSTAKREVRGSNAAQWAMIQDAIAAGAAVYDLRGITDTLDADDGHVGLIQFKVGTGGEAVEHVGEWDLPLRRATYAAFSLYMSRR